MIPRYDAESQRQFVDRVLRAEGRFATIDALYNLTYHGGRKCSITRLAAIIHDLRHEDGWDIATTGGAGETAVYHLRYCPPLRDIRVTGRREPSSAPTAATVIADAALPGWVRAWRCADCGGRPAAEPAEMLGALGRGPCAVCGANRYFRRVA